MPGRPLRAAGIELQPVTALHWLALRRMKSPILTPGAALDEMDSLRALLLLSTPADQVEALLALSAAKLQKRLHALAARIDLGRLADIPLALVRIINAAFATAIPPADSGQKKTAGSGGSYSRSSRRAPSTAGPTSTR